VHLFANRSAYKDRAFFGCAKEKAHFFVPLGLGNRFMKDITYKKGKAMTIENDAIQALYTAHYDRMLLLARIILHNDDEAKDAVSDVFVHLTDYTTQLHADTTEAFLLTCVRNECLKVIRKKQLKQRVRQLLPTADTVVMMPFDEKTDQLQEVHNFSLHAFTPQTYNVFRLRYEQHLSYRQIAEQLHISEAAVYKHIAQALTKLSNVELSATRKWLHATLGYTYTKNAIVWMPTLYNNQEIAFLRNVNCDRLQQMYASVVASPKLGWYQPLFEISFLQTYFDAAKYNSTLPEHKPDWTFRANNKFEIGKSCTAYLNMRYQTSRTDDIMYSKWRASLDAGIIKSFLNKALTVNLSGKDLLRTTKERWTIYGDHVNLSKDCYNYSRQINLTVTYNFNTSRRKYKGTGAGNEERKRL